VTSGIFSLWVEIYLCFSSKTGSALQGSIYGLQLRPAARNSCALSAAAENNNKTTKTREKGPSQRHTENNTWLVCQVWAKPIKSIKKVGKVAT
jgi:hypothetical protein